MAEPESLEDWAARVSKVSLPDLTDQLGNTLGDSVCIERRCWDDFTHILFRFGFNYNISISEYEFIRLAERGKLLHFLTQHYKARNDEPNYGEKVLEIGQIKEGDFIVSVKPDGPSFRHIVSRVCYGFEAERVHTRGHFILDSSEYIDSDNLSVFIKR